MTKFGSLADVGALEKVYNDNNFDHDLFGAEASVTAFETEHALSVLFVGATVAEAVERANLTGRNEVFVGFDELTQDRLLELAPDVVLSPMVTRQFDCLELAHRLHAFGFQGRYRAIAPDLPRPELVRNEVRGQFPTLDFDVLMVAPQEARVRTG